LATEAEWEFAAAGVSQEGNFADSGLLRPVPAPIAPGLRQVFGDVWEWTGSAYLPYPGFEPPAGAVGATPASHIRSTYRNFFPPAARWQFSGVRLAQDVPASRSAKTVDTLCDNFRNDVLEGLSCSQKRVPPRWFYDDRGSELYEEITQLPEYYPSRTETQILHDHARQLAAFCGENRTILEYGAGSGVKTEILLRALRNPRIYVPIDISADYLNSTTHRLRREFPDLAIRAVAADFCTDLTLPDWIPLPNRVAFFPGSTIGNLDTDEIAAFLRRMRVHAGESGKAIVGVDLRKSRDVLLPAYDDAAGVTARFNLNLLTRINRELGGNFRLDSFQHVARWNETESAVEMHLVSRCAQSVVVAGRQLHFKAGESIHTESSRKFEIAGFRQIALQNGWRTEQVWTDQAARFAVFGLSVMTPQ
jgi:dimethylhistidine N-methyltransferase